MDFIRRIGSWCRIPAAIAVLILIGAISAKNGVITLLFAITTMVLCTIGIIYTIDDTMSKSRTRRNSNG